MSAIPSLLREREGYVRRGLPDRVAAVDAVLASLGYHELEVAVPAPVENTSAKRAPGRPRKVTDG